MKKYAVIAISIAMILSIAAGSAFGMVHTAGASNSVAVNSNVVHPNNYYSKEPAPMGIVDYGIGPNGNGLYFNSTSFTGIVNITDLKTYNASIASCPNNMGIQLNLILSFDNAGTNYSYWVQNVAMLNTSSHNVAIIDNIWNFTSPTSEMHNSTICGNGKVHSFGSEKFYYDAANNGTFSPFNYSHLELRSISYASGGYPHIHMEYNNGSGWVTYDKLNFTFATNVSSNYNFIVNGSESNAPNGLPVDAGFILGGPGNGTKTKIVDANLTMALEYWNGNNYQAVSDTYNHGSDTAEGVCNASIVYNSASGIPMATVETGNTTLGELYNSGNVSDMNFTAYLKNGYITLNGMRYNYTGESINLTLNPGTYNLTLYSKSGQAVYNHTYSLLAGQSYSFSTRHSYNVTFTETGLSAGTEWSVDVNGNVLHSDKGNITFTMYNGTYNYSVTPISGYSVSNGNGTFNVNGNAKNVTVAFTRDNTNHIPAPINNKIDYKMAISLGILAIVALLAIYALMPRKRKN